MYYLYALCSCFIGHTCEEYLNEVVIGISMAFIPLQKSRLCPCAMHYLWADYLIIYAQQIYLVYYLSLDAYSLTMTSDTLVEHWLWKRTTLGPTI